MDGQVEEAEKDRRVAVLEDLCTRLHTEFYAANKGIAERVLFESTRRGSKMEGYSGNYIRIERDYDENLVGKLTDVIL